MKGEALAGVWRFVEPGDLLVKWQREEDWLPVLQPDTSSFHDSFLEVESCVLLVSVYLLCLGGVGFVFSFCLVFLFEVEKKDNCRR